MLRPFTLHRPPTAEAACALLAELGEDAVPYAGGTELLLLMKEGLLRPRHLVDIKRVPGFDAITAGAGVLRIGAAVTHRALERSPAARGRWPLLASAAQHVANIRVRNVGTVGGNLAFADPHSDLATLFLALDARLELISPRGRRDLTVDQFVQGPWDTVRRPDELLAGITLTAPHGERVAGVTDEDRRPARSPRTAAAYVKFGTHERPTLGVAIVLRLESENEDDARVADARVVIGCVNPRPTRIEPAEARLAGKALADLDGVGGEVAADAAELADPGDDLHGSADWKRAMVSVFTRRALAAAAARARGLAVAVRYPYTVVA